MYSSEAIFALVSSTFNLRVLSESKTASEVRFMPTSEGETLLLQVADGALFEAWAPVTRIVLPVKSMLYSNISLISLKNISCIYFV